MNDYKEYGSAALASEAMLGGSNNHYDISVQDGGDECECGGTFDQYDCCSDCSMGHDDCETNECFACMERAMDRAERWADMARDEEMGL
jgi:hypothetical protein